MLYCHLFDKMPKRGRDSTKDARPSSKKSRKTTVRSYRMPSSMRPETKYFDTVFSANCGSAADWTGTEVTCTSYVQSDGTTVGAYTDCALIPSAVGAGYGQIVGNKYHLKKIRVKGCLQISALQDQADVTASRDVRVILVMDTQPNGSQAQGEDIMTDLGGAGQCNLSFLAMGAGGAGRFRILGDRHIKMNKAVAGTDGANTNSVAIANEFFKFTHSFKKPVQVMVKASSSTPSMAVLNNCNIFLLAHTNSSTGVPTCFGAARAYYLD